MTKTDDVSAVSWITTEGGTEVPRYELSARFVHYCIQAAGVEFYFKMARPDRSAEVKRFFDEFFETSTALDSGTVELSMPYPEGTLNFVSRHFVEILNAEKEDDEGNVVPVPVEEQRQWLNDPSQEVVRQAIFSQGIDGTRLKNAPIQKKAIITFNTDRSVEFDVKLYDPKREDTVWVPIKTRFRKIMAADREQWRKATQRVQMGRTSTTRVNLDKIEMFYEDMVRSVSGYLIEGSECSEENKAKWVPLVPYTHKFTAILNLFGRAATKNA